MNSNDTLKPAVLIYNTKAKNLKCAHCGAVARKYVRYPHLWTIWRGIPWYVAFLTGIAAILTVINFVVFTIISVNADVIPSTGIVCYIVVLFFIIYIWWVSFYMTQHQIPRISRRYLHGFIISFIAYSLMAITMIIIVLWIDYPTYTICIVLALLTRQTLLKMIFYYYYQRKETDALRTVLIVQKNL